MFTVGLVVGLVIGLTVASYFAWILHASLDSNAAIFTDLIERVHAGDYSRYQQAHEEVDDFLNEPDPNAPSAPQYRILRDESGLISTRELITERHR